jgi:WhiB family redox-sensing transcriptional regulator
VRPAMPRSEGVHEIVDPGHVCGDTACVGAVEQIAGYYQRPSPRDQWHVGYARTLDPDCVTLAEWTSGADQEPPETLAERPVPVDLIGLLRLPEWWGRANCLGMDPAAFHPGPGQDASAARAVCAGCTVQVECLERALAIRGTLGRDNDAGVWGGTTERERKAIAAERRKAVA